jgi:MHS family proline/betaine transporter-like MFS transporter
MAYTIFGGTAPLVATWLISTTGSNLSPAFYLIAIALLALAGGLALPETARISLHDVSTDEKGVGVNAAA